MEYETVNIYEVDGKTFTFDSLVGEVEKVAREAHWVAVKPIGLHWVAVKPIELRGRKHSKEEMLCQRRIGKHI